MDWMKILELILIPVMAIIGLFAGIYWGKAKEKVTAITAFFEVLKEALKDDKITAEEIAAIVEAFKAIISGGQVTAADVTTIRKLLTKK